MAPLAERVQKRVRLLTEVEPMIAFLIDDPVVIDDDARTKAMVKGKAAPEMLDPALAAVDEPADREEARIRPADDSARGTARLAQGPGQSQHRKRQEHGAGGRTGQAQRA